MESNHTFTWNIMYGDNPDDKTIHDRGIITAEEYITQFNSFPWTEEINKANKVQNCSPTITVVNTHTNYEFFVSGYGENDDPEPTFLIGIIHPLSNIDFNNCETTEKEQVINASRLFFNNEKDELISMIKRIEQYNRNKIETRQKNFSLWEKIIIFFK